MRTTYLLSSLLTVLPVLALAQNLPVSTNKPPVSTIALPVSTNKPFVSINALSLSTNSLPSPGNARLQQTLPKTVGSDAEFQVDRALANVTTSQVSRLTLEGALVHATEAGQPWQVLNPFAPMEFGDGFDNVMVDARTQQPGGVTLFSLRFGKLGRNRK
jgi:hypothetical protein